MIEITIPEGTAPLYHQYPTQNQPQGAYVEIDPQEGSVRADYDGEIGGGVPADVWHGAILRVSVPAESDPGSLRMILESDRGQALLARVIDGHEVLWDGSNWIGRLSDDASEALDALERQLAEVELASVWDTGDWCAQASSADLGLTADTTDEQLEEIADQLQVEASSNGVALLTGLDRELERRAVSPARAARAALNEFRTRRAVELEQQAVARGEALTPSVTARITEQVTREWAERQAGGARAGPAPGGGGSSTDPSTVSTLSTEGSS